MKLNKYKVPTCLSDYILSFTVLEAENLANICTGRVIPHEYFELAFNLGETIFINRIGEEKYTVKKESAVFFGQIVESFQLQLPQKMKTLIVKIFPWAMTTFTKYPIAELRGQIILPEFVFGKEINEVYQQLGESSSDQAGIKILEAFFRRKVAEENIQNSVFQSVSSIIMQQKGFVSIKKIGQQLGISRRTIELQFQSRLGITSSQFARKTRLRYAAKMLSEKPSWSYTSLAHNCGYFDQAHFIRDFKALIEQTPKNFFRNRPFVEDFLK